MLPSSLLHFSSKHKSDDSVSNYSAYVDTIEDTVRALSLLLPGRFEDSDLCSQAVLTGLNLVSLYHTKFLVRKSNSLRLKQNEAETETFNDRFLQCNDSNWICKSASLVLSVISYSEVVMEMLLNKKVAKNLKWKYIATLEGFKGVLRLLLFYGTEQRMILHPTHLIRNVDPISLDIAYGEKYELTSIDPRTGTALSSTHDTSRIGTSQPKNRRGWAHMSEILWIIRPFVYALMIFLQQRTARKHELIRKKANGEGSDEEKNTNEEGMEKDDEGFWKPWLVSLAVDMASRISRHMQTMSPLEKDESRRRDYLLIYYLLKGPLYLKFTRNILDAFCNATEHRPLISIVTAAINDYRPFWEDSYFYTSGS
ncbi:peroxisome membrane protein [Parasitella parasitica]|nr:peroxisome membrane protein [Parasitella parasitica]